MICSADDRSAYYLFGRVGGFFSPSLELAECTNLANFDGRLPGKRTKRPVDKKALGRKGRRTKRPGTGRPAFLTPLGHEG